MAFSNLFSSPQKIPDDQFDTPSSTPPKGSTPQPDPTDRRLPSILSSYFGQVGGLSNSIIQPHHPPLSPSASPSSLSPSTTSSRMSASVPQHRTRGAGPETNSHGKVGGDHQLPITPDSSSQVSPCEEVEESSVLPHSRQPAPSHQQCRNTSSQHPYPTPPHSSSSSLYKAERSMPGGDGGGPGVNESSQSSQSRRQSPLNDLSSHLRSFTLSSDNPTSVTTTHTVHAPHISKPGLQLSDSNPASPLVPRHSASRTPSASSTPSDHERLTERVASSRNQNTPPRTPRSLSHESKPSRAASPHPIQTPPTTTPSSKPTKRHSSATEDAVIGQPKGKLAISITEGRGLKPSVDPYVVCQFQYNEYISKGPRGGSTHSDEDGARDSLRGGFAMQRTDSESGRPMAIPMKSRQSSQTSFSSKDHNHGREVTHPIWNHDAVFDVVGELNELDISVYDRSHQEAFLGHVRFCPNLNIPDEPLDQWLKLEPREATQDNVTGEIHLKITFHKVEKRHYGPEDFQILKLIGKGTFGQVFQVRKKDTQRVYAMKVLSKKVIVQKKEVQHTLGERNILVRTAMADSPFIVGLKFSFQTPSDLYLVTDYMSGGELFWHLQKEGRFQEERAKFYIAELILALQHLHQHDIVYRDLKPENILLDANGHIALCDFGLSKANLTKDDTTNTFCGTTEYLAPEVLLDEKGYTKMVDFWSLGVLVFEMCCGWSPFYADDTQQMYKNIAFGKVRFPRDALSTEGRNFVKGLLNRNPSHRLGANGDAEELKQHPFFSDVDWDTLAKKNVVPPFKPRLKSELDTSNFDPEFTNALNGGSSLNARAAALVAGANPATTPLSPTVQANFRGFTFVDESSLDKQYSNESKDSEPMEADGEGEGELRDWEFEPRSPTVNRGDRMSGVQATGGGQDEGMFRGDEI